MAELVRVAAVDLGASSGRVVVATVGPTTLELHEVHRFENVPVRVRGTLHTDILRLYHEVLAGLRAAGAVDAVGIDSWAVDYGLLDADGALLGNPVHYRDDRTVGVMDKALAGTVTAREVYATTGIQFLPFNTAWQLLAAEGTAQLEMAERLLLLPDLLGYWLTGRQVAEITNASTTQLLDVRRRAWSEDLVDALGLDGGILPQLVQPGEVIGPVLADVAGTPPLIAVGSHDTASAVVAVPADGTDFAYISSGTWSLVGVELDQPVLTEESRQANFTNELGVDGTVRYLRNVMGLWLLQESMRTWQQQGIAPDLEELLAEAAQQPAGAAVIDPDDTAFLTPGDMPSRIADACRRTGQRVPDAPAAFARCILDSLAAAYAQTLEDACRLSGRDVDVIHVVGGGSQNALLCQLTADACGRPVIAGPVEATALGNALVQARALGAAPDDLAGLRALVRTTHTTTRYDPR